MTDTRFFRRVEDPDARFNWERLFRVLIDTGDRKVKLRFGTTTISIAAANSGNANVTHGMGSTPVAVLCTTNQLNWFASADTIGASTFRTQVREYQAANVTVDVVVYWAALG